MSKIFLDEKSLLPGSLPPKLPFREEEMKTLASNFKVHFNKRLKSQNQNLSTITLILGGTGQGKTTLARITTDHIIDLAKSNSVKLIKSYQNCWKQRTLVGVISSVFEDLNVKGIKKGISLDEQLAEYLLPYLKEKDTHLLLVLDEINRLKGDEINSIFSLIESNASYISMIFISRPMEWKILITPDLNQRITDAITLPNYSGEEITAILRYRASLALQSTAFDDEIIELTSQITQNDQNLRLGLEILYRAAKNADKKDENTINADYIRDAKSQSFPELRSEIMEELKVHELLTLLGITRRLSNKKFTALYIKDAYKFYKIACSEYFEEPKKESSFRSYLGTLNNLGLISQVIAPSGRGKRGVKARISVTDIPVNLLIERVEEQLDQLYA